MSGVYRYLKNTGAQTNTSPHFWVIIGFDTTFGGGTATLAFVSDGAAGAGLVIDSVKVVAVTAAGVAVNTFHKMVVPPGGSFNPTGSSISWHGVICVADTNEESLKMAIAAT